MSRELPGGRAAHTLRVSTTLTALALCACLAPAQRKAGDVHLRPVTLRAAGGLELRAEIGQLWVPENRRRENSRLIVLAFVRLLSTSKNPGAPLIYLHGGPGGSATGAGRNPRALAQYAGFLAQGDFILLDQRGCGRSTPRLARPLKDAPPPGVMRTRDAYEEWLARASAKTKAALESEGVDISGYDTEQSADDVDALRRALGAKRMRLLGFSYGTHLGLSVIRRHGANVKRAVLIGVEGPGDTRKLPSTYDAQIKKLALLVAADPNVKDDVPDFEGLLRRVLAKLEENPMEVRVPQPVSGRTVTVAVGADALRMILVRDIGDTADLPVFPRLLWTIDQGDSSVLTWFVRKRYSGVAAFPTHAFTMDPASGCSGARAARIASEASSAILRDAMNFTFAKVDAVWRMPILCPEFREPLVTDVQTLFLSGTLDSNTPPYQAEQVQWGFVNSTHLVQRNGGHEDWQRNRKAMAAVLDFLGGQSVDGRGVDLPRPRFIPVKGQVGGHPSLGR